MRERGTGISDRGTGKVKLWLVLVAVAVGAVIAVFPLMRQDAASTVNAVSCRAGEKGNHPTAERTTTVGRAVLRAPQSQKDEVSAGDDSESNGEPQTEEEKREAEEERLVNAFDDLTDKWQEPSSRGVTMADIDNFSKMFRSVPRDRQDECINRALNLIPDENVMLLAGVLMDKSMDKEIIETVYNDVLNRDEDVKKPILQQIFRDKAHSCWADTAWILDVTGELPK